MSSSEQNRAKPKVLHIKNWDVLTVPIENLETYLPYYRKLHLFPYLKDLNIKIHRLYKLSAAGIFEL